MRNIKVCLVEDDEIMGASLCDRFALEGIDCAWYRDGESAFEAIRHCRYSLVICDIRLPDCDGGEMFRRIKETLSTIPPFIFITGYGSIDRAVQLLKLGAADYVSKPFDLGQLIEKIHLLCRNDVSTCETISAVRGTALGISAAMRRIEDMLPRLAQRAQTVLITGESGVGKEHVTYALHLAGNGERRPFVAVNCGALPENLYEAELFGYEKGAFTNALRMKKGYFEQANGGMLFLDEVGEMPLAMQVKLLRAVQERSIRRVGGEKPIPLDFKLICATNRDLKDMVERGEFREDLFYRINVVHLKVPPLRERKEDTLWFADRFLREYADHHMEPQKDLQPSARQALVSYAWPGNIRELKNVIERACILSSSPALTMEDLFPESNHLVGDIDPRLSSNDLNEYLEGQEKEFLLSALERHDWKIGDTAQSVGISRKNLWQKMRKLDIQVQEANESPPVS
ncbi:sigma-54 dependent transcriptional regulator [Thermithiobacillus plumbiphilus]|uniref:Sigma-54 dependent transcriptional regulator n=1 Tax=Thermithiobacillus plumbiphilus TaxID=1729899 RepID=A0ABU9D4U5_9PROT